MEDGMIQVKEDSSAYVSKDGLYRYWLRRRFPESKEMLKKSCVFIMLNPSVADAVQDDPTIRRCIGFSQKFKCTDLVVVNLYGFRATEPKDLIKAGDPVGPENNFYVKTLSNVENSLLIAGWGAFQHRRLDVRKRVEEVIALIDRPIFCLGVSKEGAPRHPLYLPVMAELEAFHLRAV